MKSLEFSIVSSSEAEDAWVDAKIDEFNRKELSFDGRQLETPMNYVAKEKNLVIAGIKSCFYLGEVVSIGVLFVDEKYRNKGLGGHLLSKVETEARIMGAKLAHLYAFDQTKDFYLKQGYEIFAVLENCPKAGHRCYYLKKNLMIYEKKIEKINSPIPCSINGEELVEKTMKITLVKASKEDKGTIQNLGRFYVYEMSRYCGFLPTWETPSNGLFECIDLSSYCEKLDRHAFLVRVDDELAGFALINKVGSTPDVDWNVGEFFIVSKFQGKGIGSYVAQEIFNRFPGIWETTQIPENKAAIDFWEKVVNKYSNGKFEKTCKIIPEPKPHPMIVLKFNSKKTQ